MYFYLEWIDKRPSQIQLVHEKPLKLTFESKFKIKAKEYIICGNINPEFKPYIVSEPIVYRKNQYLLSHLQKCVRRMESTKSVQTAKHLLDLDCTSLLRRLPIIMLEDVTFHESFPVLIWLMIAYSKKFTMKQEIVKWILGVVYYISTCSQKTHYETKDINEIDCSDNQNIYVDSLRFRKAYGGMKGDMNMIEYYTQLLYRDKLGPRTEKIKLIKLEIKPLLKKEWIYQSNDFHCNRSIIIQMQRYFSEYSKDYLKELIWNHSSSINNRIIDNDKIYDTKQLEDWKRIEKTLHSIQKKCIYY